MLGALRENSRSLIIWVLFGIIIAFFILSFGPQASTDQFSCTGRSPYVARVDSAEIQETSWRFGMNGLGFASGSGGKEERARERVMDRLVARELFAQAAAAAGFEVPDTLVDQRIADGNVFILGQPVPGKQVYFDEAGAFDFDRLQAYSNALGLTSVAQFREEQKRELLADLMRQLLLQSTRVSPEEVLARFTHQNTTVTINYLKYRPLDYERGLALSDAELDGYLAEHADEVQAKYTAEERTYKGVPKQVRARHIFIAKPDITQVASDALEGKQDDLSHDEQRQRLQAARKRIEGGASFAAVATEVSEDERTRARGGDLGWRSASSLGWGPALSEAAQSLEVDALSEIIETERGFHLLLVEDTREGDLAFDDVKREIAETMALAARAQELARADAEKALAEAKAAGKPLDELYAAAPGEEDAAAAPRTPPHAEGVDPPEVAHAAGITQQDAIVTGAGGSPYVGKNAALMDALFGDGLAAGAYANQVYEVEDGFVVVQLTERKDADLAQLEDQRDTLATSLASEKSRRLLGEWAMQQCQRAAADGDIVVNSEFVSYANPEGDLEASDYQLCGPGFGLIF